MENYIKYRVMGSVSQIRMKPGCVPTRFECQAEREAQTSGSIEQPHVAKKTRKKLLGESLTPLAKKSTRKIRIKTASTALETLEPVVSVKQPIQRGTAGKSIRKEEEVGSVASKPRPKKKQRRGVNKSSGTPESGTSKELNERTVTSARRNNQSAAMTLDKLSGEDDILIELQNDMANYVEYTTMGGVSRIRMRPGCLPTKFACQPMRVNTCPTTDICQLAAAKRQTIALTNKHKEKNRSAGFQQSVNVNEVPSQDADPLYEQDQKRITKINKAAPINVIAKHGSKTIRNVTKSRRKQTSPIKFISKPSIEANASQTLEYNTTSSRTNTRRRKQTADVKLPEAEEIVARVYKFLQAEYELLKHYIGDICDLSPLTNVLKRTADACGVSEYTVKHVVRNTRSQGDQNVAGVSSSLAEEQTSCGDSEIEKDDKLMYDVSEMTDEELNTTDSVDEPEDNVERTDDISEERDECEVEAPNMDIDDYEVKPSDPLKIEPIEIKTEFADLNPSSITKKKSRRGVPNINQDDIELTGDESDERIHCEEAVEVKTESSDVLYSLSSSGITLVTSLATVKTEPEDDPPRS